MSKKKDDKIWVLTREINQYDQDGEYFVYAWPYKPGVREVQKAVGSLFTDYPKWLLATGGGRQKTEDEWFYLSSLQDYLVRTESAQQLTLFNDSTE